MRQEVADLEHSVHAWFRAELEQDATSSFFRCLLCLRKVVQERRIDEQRPTQIDRDELVLSNRRSNSAAVAARVPRSCSAKTSTTTRVAKAEPSSTPVTRAMPRRRREMATYGRRLFHRIMTRSWPDVTALGQTPSPQETRPVRPTRISTAFSVRNPARARHAG